MNNLIIIPIKVNNSDTLNFILDSGLNTTIITELSFSDSFLLNYAEELKLHGLGQGEPLDAIESHGNVIKIGKITGYNQKIYVLMENIFHISKKLGYRVHGILGYDIFDNFIIEVNYDREYIVFHDPEYFEYKKIRRKEERVPLEIHDTKSYLNVILNQANGKVVKVKLLIDTGASHSLWLDISSDEKLKLPEKTIRMYLGSGLNGEIYGSIGRVENITIGDYVVENVIVSYPDSSAIVNAIGLGERNGSLGSDILKRFNFIIDYKKKSLSLRKNKYYKLPFDYNMAGIEVIAPYPGVKYYVIFEIREDSPAERAGLKVGDELFSINNKPVDKLTISDISNMFRKKDGKKIKINVYRNGTRKKYVFRLEKII